MGVLAEPASAQSAYRVTDLGTLGNHGTTDDESVAFSVNDLGQVVGWSTRFIDDVPRVRAFLWLPEADYGRAAGMHDLGILGGPDGGASEAHGINESGQVVGTSSIAAGRAVGFLWLPASFGGLSAGMHDLPTVNAGDEGEAWALDDGNPLRVVGAVESTCSGPAGDRWAFEWRSDQPSSLSIKSPQRRGRVRDQQRGELGRSRDRRLLGVLRAGDQQPVPRLGARTAVELEHGPGGHQCLRRNGVGGAGCEHREADGGVGVRGGQRLLRARGILGIADGDSRRSS
jgi:probable HAF family extracellular repeat protein